MMGNIIKKKKVIEEKVTVESIRPGDRADWLLRQKKEKV